MKVSPHGRIPGCSHFIVISSDGGDPGSRRSPGTRRVQFTGNAVSFVFTTFLKDLESNVSDFFGSGPVFSCLRVPRWPLRENTRFSNGFQGFSRGSTPRAACPPGGTPARECVICLFSNGFKVFELNVTFYVMVFAAPNVDLHVSQCFCKVFAGARPACGFAGDAFAIGVREHPPPPL